MNLAILTDEVAPDLDTALATCEEYGIASVELRMIDGRSWLDLDPSDAVGVVEGVRAQGFDVPALATPIFKCPLPGHEAPADAAMHGGRLQSTLAEHWDLLDRALATAASAGVPMLRIFSCWRVDEPSAVVDEVAEIVVEAQRRAAGTGVEVLLENEHDCNVATAAETAAILERIPGLRVIWDAANHVRAGGDPSEAPLAGWEERIGHVHVKDFDAGRWAPLGRGCVPFDALVANLERAGYSGVLSLETHCEIDGSREAANRAAIDRLRAMIGGGA